MNMCSWKEINSFANQNEFDWFSKFINEKIIEGDAQELEVSEIAEMDERWFKHINSDIIWRLIPYNNVHYAGCFILKVVGHEHLWPEPMKHENDNIFTYWLAKQASADLSNKLHAPDNKHTISTEKWLKYIRSEIVYKNSKEYDLFKKWVNKIIIENTINAIEISESSENEEIWFSHAESQLIWKISPYNNTHYTGYFLSKDIKRNCLWPEVHGENEFNRFSCIEQYEQFIRWLDKQVCLGFAIELDAKNDEAEIGERWFKHVKSQLVWRLIPYDNTNYTGCFILKSEKFECCWPEISFTSFSDFKCFSDWLEKEISLGVAKEIKIEEPSYPGDKWFLHVKSDTKWRLPWPDRGTSFTKIN